jgi:hypothetical protein
MAITKVTRNLLSTGIDDQSNATAITIDSSENVGIGTTSPARPLHTEGVGVLLANTGGTHEVLFGDNAYRYFSLYTPASPDYMSIRTGTTDLLTVNADGKVSIGGSAISNAALTIINSANTKLIMRQSTATAGEYWRQEVDASNDLYIIDNAGTGVYITDGSTSWSGISDENLKENIVELTGVLDKVKDFRCVEYNLIADEDSSKKIGFIAQDWQEDYSQVVSQDNDGNLGMKYTETIPVLLKAIQEQQALIEAQTTTITDLTTRIETLENA